MNDLLGRIVAISLVSPQVKKEDNKGKPCCYPKHTEYQVVQRLAKKRQKGLIQAAIATTWADAYRMQEEHD
ncbi:MAG: hypothetical protein U1D69_08480 [Polynucleobacter sp.]|nr:hypothetical protein [Polynucleobacter sp.]